MTLVWPDGYWRILVEGRAEQSERTPAHLFAYASQGDNPNIPRCAQAVDRAMTRPATSDEPHCHACEDWYAYNVMTPHVG